VRWAREHGTDEGYPAELLNLPASGTAPQSSPPPRRAPTIRRGLVPGVAVLGYLRGELGIGESARLMVAALQAAGVPHAAVPIEQGLLSRRSSGGDPPTPAAAATRFDTSLVCVNADLTPAVAAAVPELFDGRRRIGMWYWEVEEFPRSQHGGFDHVDEVWVATDFVRRAVEPHSPVPVRIVTPPLPQRGAEPTLTRADLGLPDRPLFLFSFDFLSTAERKNPWGLIDAFRLAFAPDEGPVLVIKSINADRRPAAAERLRLHAAGHPDVLLLEEYLDAAGRDALVALCDVYVSLHRSEGLGLTMAEAMARGKPVIATGYSGNLQFMTEENSFLVPWVPVAIPPDAEPYPAGGTWADPDLPAAAAAMRLVIQRPDVAAARGARAAADIATLHSPAAAGREAARRLSELTGQRGRTPSRIAAAARRLARRVRRGLG
jgi:glycosyltransferase involved in cell wall biosynthesis